MFIKSISVYILRPIEIYRWPCFVIKSPYVFIVFSVFKALVESGWRVAGFPSSFSDA